MIEYFLIFMFLGMVVTPFVILKFVRKFNIRTVIKAWLPFVISFGVLYLWILLLNNGLDF